MINNLTEKRLHVAIIPDGNRRWAKKKHLSSLFGHKAGVNTVENVLKWCNELKCINELTLYIFSIENFQRDKKEINYLMDLFKYEFKKFSKKEYLDKYKVRFNFIGRIGMFPKDIQEIIFELAEKSKKYNDFICNVALGYGGRAEIIDGVKKIIRKKVNPNQIDENLFSKYIYTDHEPDILIRTGGEIRVSNFLIWQSNYSELFFVDKFWPEFKKDDLVKIINEFHKRERRFGR